VAKRKDTVQVTQINFFNQQPVQPKNHENKIIHNHKKSHVGKLYTLLPRDVGNSYCSCQFLDRFCPNCDDEISATPFHSS